MGINTSVNATKFKYKIDASWSAYDNIDSSQQKIII